MLSALTKLQKHSNPLVSTTVRNLKTRHLRQMNVDREDIRKKMYDI